MIVLVRIVPVRPPFFIPPRRSILYNKFVLKGCHNHITDGHPEAALDRPPIYPYVHLFFLSLFTTGFTLRKAK